MTTDPQERNEEDQLVASVAGKPITVADLEARVAAIRRGPVADRLPAEGSPEDLRLRRWVVQLLVTEAIVVHEAMAAGIPVQPGTHTAPETMAAMAAAGQLPNGADPVHALATHDAARRLFERVTAHVTVPEAHVRAYYRDNPDLYRRPENRRVRHVLVADEATARGVAARITAGEEFAAIARELSTDQGTRRRGGDLGAVRRGELVGPFEDAVFAADAGAVVGPVATEFGWHVARVEAVHPARSVSYADARPGILADLLAAARGRVFDGWLAERRAGLVTVAPTWLHPGDPRLPDAVHRH